MVYYIRIKNKIKESNMGCDFHPKLRIHLGIGELSRAGAVHKAETHMLPCGAGMQEGRLWGCRRDRCCGCSALALQHPDSGVSDLLVIQQFL